MPWTQESHNPNTFQYPAGRALGPGNKRERLTSMCVQGNNEIQLKSVKILLQPRFHKAI